MQPRIGIVILNWNNSSDTLQCIRSLIDSTYKNISIIVVDNGSKDDSLSILSKLTDERIKLLARDNNEGFAGGNNFGIRQAIEDNCAYIWLLNSDAVIAPDCLEKLISAAIADPTAGLLSPVIYHMRQPEKIQECGSRLNLSLSGIEEAKNIDISKTWHIDTPDRIVLWGTALLINSALYLKIGGLDEKLFAYSEDTDYSIRGMKAGFINKIVFDASIWHSSTDGVRKPHYYYYTSRNVTLMWRKHVKPSTLIRLWWWNIERTRKVVFSLKGHPELVAACKLGVWDGIFIRGGGFVADRTLPTFARVVLSLLFIRS